MLRLVCVSLLVVGASAWIGGHSVKQVDVCIVGAGPGGLAAANYLETHGKTVAIFEKNSRPGGKVYSPSLEGDVGTFPQDLGATITSLDYPAVEEFVVNLGLTGSKIPPAIPLVTDIDAGFALPLTALLDQETVVTQLGNFSLKIATDPDFINLFSRFGFGHVEVTPQLEMPILTWLTVNGFTALIPVFGFLLSNFGYGNMFEVPTMYAIRSVTPKHLIATVTAANQPELLTRNSFANGFQEVTDAMWDNIQGDKHLDVDVRIYRCLFAWPCLSRSQLFIDGVWEYKCKKVINAFPPTLDNMKAVYPYLTWHEKSLFSDVTFSKYASGAWKNFNPASLASYPVLNLLPALACVPEGCNYFGMGINYDVTDGANNNIGAAFTYNDGSNVWGGDFYAENEADWRSNVTYLTTAFGDAINATVDYFPETYNDWQFWPRFPADKIAQHAAFEDLQGSRRSYYVSGFNNFEATGRVMEFAKQLVNDMVAENNWW